MPRWVIILLVVVAVAFWLVGTGLHLSGSDAKEPSPDEAGETGEDWFGGLDKLFPDPAPLRSRDVRLSPACGQFPRLRVAPGNPCDVVVLEGEGRRQTRVRLEEGQIEIKITPPRGKAPPPQNLPDDEVTEDGYLKLQFGEDGGKLSISCRSEKSSCAVMLAD